MASQPTFAAFACFLAAALLSGCARREALDYSLSLNDFHGAEGYSLIYDITPRSLRITYTDDYGSPDTVLWQTELSPAQQQSFTRFAEALPLDKLKSRYINRGVADGYQYRYRLRIGPNPVREITVSNMPQPQLDPLIDLINEVVPEEYRAASPRGSVQPSGYDD